MKSKRSTSGIAERHRRHSKLLVVAVVVSSGPALAQESAPPQTEPTSTPASALPPLPAPAPDAVGPLPTASASAARPPAPAPPPPPPRTEQLETARHLPRGPRHDGLYLRLSLGFDYLSVWGNDTQGSASVSGGGAGFGIAVGGSLARGLVLGGLFRFAYTVAPFHGGPAAASTTAGSTVPSALNPNADATFVQLGALVDYYPDPESGWHAAASVGIGNIIVIPQATGADMSTATAFTALLLGGYEWRLGGDWSLGLLAVASGATSATLYDSGNNSTGYHLQPLSAGLEGSLLFY